LFRALWNGLHLIESHNHERTSMTKEIVTTSNAPYSPLYSQAVKAGGLVFVSGQVGQDPDTGKLAGSTVQEQTRQCLKNIAAILGAAGSSMEKIVSATFILRNRRGRPVGVLRRHRHGVSRYTEKSSANERTHVLSGTQRTHSQLFSLFPCYSFFNLSRRIATA
jgi:enamine deaminase RidA (YjgF/YER057c/UK114 family)